MAINANPKFYHLFKRTMSSRLKSEFLRNQNSFRVANVRNFLTYHSAYHPRKKSNHLIIHSKDQFVLNQSKVRFSSNDKANQIRGKFPNCVLVSRSRDIFENLAIEDWLYRYQDFDHNKLLLIWYNKPSIVIGRHQNPWQEVNLDQCIKSNVSIARRNSGGGTVYHDEKNLNICFFASKRDYNRRNNLEFIRSAIKTNFEIDLKINTKEDLVLDKTNEKVSGTASKLAYNKSYHHCTLLIGTDLHRLSHFIRKKSDSIVSNATKSVYSPVRNLSSINPEIEIENVIDAIVNRYQSVKPNIEILYVDFDEQTFPTIRELRDQLIDWSWVFGRTPKFKVINHDSINDEQYTCELNVVKGLIDNVDLYRENRLSDCVLDVLKGKKLILEDCESCLNDWLRTRNDFQSVYFCKLVLDTIRTIR